METIKENTVFRRVYHRGKCTVTPTLVVYIMRTGLGMCRVGITSSKKIGNAVTRNRARRVIRAALAAVEGQLSGSCDIVIVARGRTPHCKSTELIPIIRSALTAAGCITAQ